MDGRNGTWCRETTDVATRRRTSETCIRDACVACNEGGTNVEEEEPPTIARRGKVTLEARGRGRLVAERSCSVVNRAPLAYSAPTTNGGTHAVPFVANSRRPIPCPGSRKQCRTILATFPLAFFKTRGNHPR